MTSSVGDFPYALWHRKNQATVRPVSFSCKEDVKRRAASDSCRNRIANRNQATYTNNRVNECNGNVTSTMLKPVTGRGCSLAWVDPCLRATVPSCAHSGLHSNPVRPGVNERTAMLRQPLAHVALVGLCFSFNRQSGQKSLDLRQCLLYSPNFSPMTTVPACTAAPRSVTNCPIKTFNLFVSIAGTCVCSF